MDLEPPSVNQKSFDHEDPLLNNGNDQTSEDEYPFSFNSTSTSLIGLAIVFVMLCIPLLAVISERSETKKSFIPISLNKNGPESSSSLTIPWFS